MPHPSSSIRLFLLGCRLCAGLAGLAGLLGSFGEAADPPLLRLVIGDRTATVEGRMTSRVETEALLGTLASARPDLRRESGGLEVSPGTNLPAFEQWRGLVTELALSTHEGRLEVWPDRIFVSGLTDSLVTLSALRIQAESLLRGRQFHHRLCVVPTEDLPRIEVTLAGGSSPGTGSGNSSGAGPASLPGRETPFAPPGLRLEKLLGAIRMLGQIDQLAGRPSAPGPGGQPLRAEPLPMSGTGKTEPAGLPSLPPTPAGPPVEVLPPLLFSRNSHLLQANQATALDELAKLLLAPERRGAPVRIEAVKPEGGSGAFNDYLCERRRDEVVRWLSERGVEPALLTSRTISSPSTIDAGEVRISVELPTPDPDPDPGEAEAETPPAATPPPAGPPPNE